MSSFNNGGGDILATNLCAAMLEVGFLLTAAEDNYNATSPQFPQNQTTFTVAQNNSSVTLTSSLPLQDSRPGGGVLGIQPRNIFAGTNFGNYNPGTAGDTTSTDLCSAFFEVVSLLDDAEKLFRANVVQSQPKMVSGYDINLATRVGTFTIILPVQFTRNPTTGSIDMAAVDVLP